MWCKAHHKWFTEKNWKIQSDNLLDKAWQTINRNVFFFLGTVTSVPCFILMTITCQVFRHIKSIFSAILVDIRNIAHYIKKIIKHLHWNPFLKYQLYSIIQSPCIPCLIDSARMIILRLLLMDEIQHLLRRMYIRPCKINKSGFVQLLQDFSHQQMFQRISDSHEMYLDLLTTGWEKNYNCNLFQKYGFTISKVCQKSGKQHIQV